MTSTCARALVLAAACALGGGARAEVIDGVFTAYVTSDANPTAWNGAAYGDGIVGSFVYDTAYLPPNDPFCASQGRGCYFQTTPPHSFLSIEMTLDGVTYDFSDNQSTTLTIGDYIQTLPGYKFDQFTVGASGAAEEVGGAAPGAHAGAAFVQVYPYVQTFTSSDPLQTFSVFGSDLRGSSANTAELDGKMLGFSTLSMSDMIQAGSAAPEPSTWAMLIVGLAALGAALRARRRAFLQKRSGESAAMASLQAPDSISFTK